MLFNFIVMPKKLKLLALSVVVMPSIILLGCQNIQPHVQALVTQKQTEDQIATAFENIQTSGVLSPMMAKLFKHMAMRLTGPISAIFRLPPLKC